MSKWQHASVTPALEAGLLRKAAALVRGAYLTPARRAGMMSCCGPKRRKRMSAPMSAMGVLEGLVLLTMSFVGRDPKLTVPLYIHARTGPVVVIVRLFHPSAGLV